jgi:serine/threonine protein kinase
MAAAFEGLGRSNLPEHIVEVLHRGSWGKADLSVAQYGGRRAVVKDFSTKSLPVRLIGWIQINRELRAYRRLQGIRGVPVIYRRLDRCAFLMEEIRGRLLPRFRHRSVDQRERLLAQLRSILDAAHAVGVIHNDARGRDNALVTEAGAVFLVDFAGAICLNPGGLLHRLLFAWLVRVDESAYLKWKAILHPEGLTVPERKRLRRYTVLRRLWIFNPKGWGRFGALDDATTQVRPEERGGRKG